MDREISFRKKFHSLSSFYLKTYFAFWFLFSFFLNHLAHKSYILLLLVEEPYAKSDSEKWKSLNFSIEIVEYRLPYWKGIHGERRSDQKLTFFYMNISYCFWDWLVKFHLSNFMRTMRFGIFEKSSRLIIINSLIRRGILIDDLKTRKFNFLF